MLAHEQRLLCHGYMQGGMCYNQDLQRTSEIRWLPRQHVSQETLILSYSYNLNAAVPIAVDMATIYRQVDAKYRH
jgi:hypothetical protein